MTELSQPAFALYEQIVVKVPMIKDGIKAIRYFHQKALN